MAFIIELRTGLLKFFYAHEEVLVRIFRFIITFFMLMMVRNTFGYHTFLSQLWVLFVLAMLALVLSMRGAAFVVALYVALQLATLSVDIAVAGVVLLLTSYITSMYFRSSKGVEVVTIPATYYIGIPYIIPIFSGLTAKLGHIPNIMFGSFIAWYLKTIHANASSFLEGDNTISVVTIIQKQMLGDRMFYIFLVSMAIMFLVVVNIRSLNIKYTGIISLAAGVLVETLIMISGYLVTSSRAEIPGLLLGNAVTFVIGLIVVGLIDSMDYSRTERFRFEDDDYFYQVTAIPKYKIESEMRKVKKYK